jgi:hypothetical protein
MHRMLLNTMLLLFFLQNAIGQPKKVTSKPAYKAAGMPSFIPRDDPSPVKYIQLKKDTPVYTPQHFYIQKIVDNTNTNDSIGFILQPKSGKRQRLSFKGGTVQGIGDYFNLKVVKDTILYPLVFILKNISLSEEKENDYRNGIFKYAYSFEYVTKDKPITIAKADGRLTYKTHITQNRYLDSNLAKAFSGDMEQLEKNMEDAINTHPLFCKGVNTSISYKTDNSPANDTIFFDGQQDLMWDDFTSTASGGDNYFLPAISLLFTPDINYENGKFQVKIKTGAYFIKSRSWVGKKIKTAQMLYHLQYRFKLAWLESVRLKRKIETTVFSCSNYETEMRQLIVNSNNQLDHIFDEYSTQTLTGSNKREQNRWQEFIDKQISDYEKIK